MAAARRRSFGMKTWMCPVGARGAGAAAAQRTHSRPGGDELQDALPPHVALHPQLNADDAVSPQMVGLGPHPGHRQFPGVVHRLSQDLQFLVLRPPSDLQANVIDRRSDHEAKRLEPGLAEQHVLRNRQVGGENARRIGAGGVGQPAVRGRRLPVGRIAGRLAAEKRHGTLRRPDSLGTRDSTRSLPAGALTARDQMEPTRVPVLSPWTAAGPTFPLPDPRDSRGRWSRRGLTAR